MSERGTLVGAGAAHLALIAALSLAWTHMERPVAPPPDAVTVDLTEIADTPKATTAPREATAPPTPPTPRAIETPPPPPMAKPTPPDPAPPPPPPKARPPEPQPIADEPAPRPKPPKAKTPKPQPDARDLSRSLDELLAKAPARAAPRPRADPNQLASLLDKELGHAPPRSTAKPGPVQMAQPANAAISPLAMATLQQAIRAQIEKCWNPPTGLPEATTVTLRIKLTDSGAAAGTPEVTGRSGAVDPATRRVFDESARRAVLRCSPLKLPKELYAQWRDIELNFDPKDVL